jgi:hypothetical protein
MIEIDIVAELHHTRQQWIPAFCFESSTTQFSTHQNMANNNFQLDAEEQALDGMRER